MKLTIDRADLADLAELAARIVPRKPANPVLGCAHLRAHASGLVLTATDYDLWGTVDQPADVITEGTVCVGAKLLNDVASVMPAGPVELVLDGNRLAVTSGSARATLPTQPAEDFPVRTDDGGDGVQVAGRLFASALENAAKMTPEPGSTPLYRVVMEATPEHLRLWASDRYRLLSVWLPWAGDPPADERTADLLPDTAGIMVRLAKGAATVGLDLPEHDRGTLSMSAGIRRVSSRLADPATRLKMGAFLEIDPPHRFRAAKVDLIDAIEQAAKFCVEKAPVVVNVVDGALTVTGGSDGDGAATLGLAVETDDWPAGGLTVAYNPGYLISMLHAVPAEMVQVALKDTAGNGQPARITPADPAHADYPMVGIIMSIKMPGA